MWRDLADWIVKDKSVRGRALNILTTADDHAVISGNASSNLQGERGDTIDIG